MKDRLSSTVVETVKEFYHLPEVSREVPGKMEVVTIKDEAGKTIVVTKHLNEHDYGTGVHQIP